MCVSVCVDEICSAPVVISGVHDLSPDLHVCVIILMMMMMMMKLFFVLEQISCSERSPLSGENFNNRDLSGAVSEKRSR